LTSAVVATLTAPGPRAAPPMVYWGALPAALLVVGAVTASILFRRRK
jgi:hypothetical protein